MEKMPLNVSVEIAQQDSLATLIEKLPYGYVSRFQWATLHTDLAKRDGQLEGCGIIMSRDRTKSDKLIEALLNGLRACEAEFGRHNLPQAALAILPPPGVSL